MVEHVWLRLWLFCLWVLLVLSLILLVWCFGCDLFGFLLVLLFFCGFCLIVVYFGGFCFLICLIILVSFTWYCFCGFGFVVDFVVLFDFV